MEARTLGPCLPTNKRPSTAATNESKFIHRFYQAPQLCSNHARPNSSSEGLPRNRLPNPLQKHIGGEKNKGWVGQAQAWLASTHEKSSVTSRQATNDVPTKHQTRSPRDAPQSPTLQSTPNQPEPIKKTPAINDPTAGSPTVTLLRLLLPLNDKVQWTSRDVAGSEPPTSPRSEHFTGPFNR